MTRAEPEGFAAFVLARGDALHHAAYQLTGDPATAEELLVGALAAAWPRWSRLRGDAEPFVRRRLSDLVAPRWHRGSVRGPVTELAVDGEPLPGPVGPGPDPDDDPGQRAADRVREVQRRVAARRRNRLRVSAAALTLIVASGVAVGVKSLQRQPHPAVRPAVSAAVRPTLPTFYDGGRIAHTMAVDLSHAGSTDVTFTPTAWGLDFAYRCPALMSGEAHFEIRVRGFVLLGADCSGSDPVGALTNARDARIDGASGDYGNSNPSARSFWQALGVRIGRPATAVVTVQQAAFAASPPPTLLVGVYQDVPFLDYPLPPRPDLVPPPDANVQPIRHARPITLPGAAVDGTWLLRVPYRSDLVVQGAVSAPGQVQVRLDGQLVGGLDSHDYEPANEFVVSLGPGLPFAGRPPRIGQTVTISVTTAYFAARDWRLEFGQADH